MSLFDTIIEDVEGYAGLVASEPTTLSRQLAEVVEEATPAIYLDQDDLSRALRAKGVSETDVLKVRLMTTVRGFRELVDANHSTKQADLDRLVRNAVAETGFDRLTVMGLVAGIARSVGVADKYELDHGETDGAEDAAVKERAFVIPASCYEDELRTFGAVLTRAEREGAPVPRHAISRIEPLVAAGVPKAKYYLGKCILDGLGDIDGATEANRGISLLQDAASAGDTQAAACLGDYYFGYGSYGWEQAYGYYTGFGAAALTKERRENVATILNHRQHVRTQLKMCAGLAVAMLAFVCVAPGADVYGTHRIIGTLCTLVAAALLLLAMRHHKSHPYDNVHFVPAGMFAAWALYMVVRLLL